jgi:alpha-L-fucosidase
MKRSLLVMLLVCAVVRAHGQPPAVDDTADRLQWFQDAKLGIFIHWGIYSVDGVDESWSFYNKKMPHADYMKQIKGFTAKTSTIPLPGRS